MFRVTQLCKINLFDVFLYFNPISDSVKNSKGRVLVHCQAGISRSATICLAYLISRHRLRLDEAYEYVKKRRSVISPNFNFMGQLLNWESETQLTERATSSTELLINTPTTSCAVTSPFGFFSFSSLPCGSGITPSSNKQNSPGLVTSPMQFIGKIARKRKAKNNVTSLHQFNVEVV